MHAGDFLVALADRDQLAPAIAGAAGSSSCASKEQARDAEIAAKAPPAGELIDPLHFFLRMEEAMADDAVLVVDGGDFVATASYIVRPRAPLSWLDPGVFGTLGVGGGFALGAVARAAGPRGVADLGRRLERVHARRVRHLRPPRRRADRGDRQRRVVGADRARAGRDPRHHARLRPAAHATITRSPRATAASGSC